MKTSKLYFAIIALLLYLSSCGDPKSKMALLNEQAPLPQLEMVDILDVQKVSYFLNSSSTPTKEANDYFLKGMDAAVNKKVIDSAVYYLEFSIKSYPTANAYYELGKLYRLQHKLDNAIVAFQLAERLDYEPYSNILYQLALIYALKDNQTVAAEYIELAIQAGFSDITALNDAEELQKLREDNYYLLINAIKNGSRGVTNPELMLWKQFKRKFLTPKYPVEITSELTYEQLEKYSYISYEFSEFVPEMKNAVFARDIGQTYHYVYNLGENEQIVSFLYLEQSYYVGDFMPKTFTIVTFTTEGKLIDKLVLRDVELEDDEMVRLRLTKPFELFANIYQLTYEKDVNDIVLFDNAVKDRIFVATYSISIATNGKIIMKKKEVAKVS